MNDRIDVFSNTLGDDEAAAAYCVMESRWLGRGKHCLSFEAEFAKHLGVDAGHVLLTNNCTSAIYIGLRALGIEPGDEVIIPSISFLGIPNAVIDLGAIPVFCDVDKHTLNATTETIRKQVGDDTKAVFVLHYGGHPAESPLYLPDDVLLIEDAANAISSTCEDYACGTLGNMGVWSFDAMKMLVMGDGGALFLRDHEAVTCARTLRYLGLPVSQSSGIDSAKKSSRWWEFEVETYSGRYISNDILAAIGRIQLEKLSQFIEAREEVWQIYQEELAGVGDIILPPEPLPGCTSSYYLYWIQTERRDELATHLYHSHNIYVTYRYYPLHLVEYYQANVTLPNAEWVSNFTLNLPLHQNLTEDDVGRVIEAVKKFFE